jgi:hypothetical protein
MLERKSLMISSARIDFPIPGCPEISSTEPQFGHAGNGRVTDDELLGRRVDTSLGAWDVLERRGMMESVIVTVLRLARFNSSKRLPPDQGRTKCKLLGCYIS